MIDYDVETTGLQPWSGKHYAFLYAFRSPEGEVALIYYNPNDSENFTTERAQIQQWFDRASTDSDGIRAWNSKFDWAFAESAGFTVPSEDKWHDGMIVAHTIDSRRSVALKAVSQTLFGEDAADLQKEVKGFLTKERARRAKEAKENDTELEEPNYSDVPASIIEPYAAEDVILTAKVADQYDPMIEQKPDLAETVTFERKVMGALYYAEKRGIPADATGYRRLEQEVVVNLEALENRCRELAAEGGEVEYEDFNSKSTPAILAALKARGADMSYMETEDGKIKSADAENLRAVDDPLAEAILDFRSEFKVLSTYVRPMIGRSYVTAMRAWKEPFISEVDGRIHSTFRQLGARTGRMSNADPNMQNQPRDDLRLRYNIVADPGYKLITCDLSGIEMALFAAYAGDGALMRALKEGGDPHQLTADMLGIRDRRRAGGAMETARQLGKTYNFSRIYGGGLRTIRKQFRCDMNQARIYKRRFDDAYPEVGVLQNRIEYALADRGYIKSLWGRRHKMHANDAYKAINYLVQGTAAELLKQAVIELHADGVPIVGLVHDEIIVHEREEKAEETMALVIKRMIAQGQPGGKLWDDAKGEARVPISADGDIVDHWSDAKLLKDDDGRKYMFTPQWAGGEKRYV